jgi:hypothetical protein
MIGHTVISRRDFLTYAAAGAGLAAYGDILERSPRLDRQRAGNDPQRPHQGWRRTRL